MAALPSLITTATLAYMALFPTDEPKSLDVRTSSSIRLPSSSFWMGVSFGMSLSWLASYEIKRRRLWQHARLVFLSWLYKDTQPTPLSERLRTPFLISDLEGTHLLRKSEDGSSQQVCGKHVELVSPDWALSSDLYCDTVRLPPGTELVPKKASGVEFYYVLEGDGQYVDDSGKQHPISHGYGFLVDPDKSRGFLVGGALSDLVLFRATDVAMSDGNNHVVRLQASSLTSTVAIIRAGLDKLSSFFEDTEESALATTLNESSAAKE